MPRSVATYSRTCIASGRSLGRNTALQPPTTPRRIRTSMAATASSSSVDAFFALLEVWEFGQASFLAARLRGRQMRLSAALQQLARCEEQYLSMEFAEQRFLRASFGSSNLERRMDGAATELESCLRSIRTRLAHTEPASLPQTPVPTPTRLAPSPTSAATPLAAGSDAASALRATAPEQPAGFLSALLRAVVTCRCSHLPAGRPANTGPGPNPRPL